MNKTIIIGNLAADPESHMTQNGVSRSNFRVAVQRRFTNQQGVREADFFNVIAWRNTADFCNRYLTKGRRVCVEGSMQNRSYDAQDGTKRYVWELIADSVEICDNKSDRTGENGNGTQHTQQTNHTERVNNTQQTTNTMPNGFEEVNDDELPF